MNHLLRTLIALALPLFWACGGPFAVFPGGALEGPVKPAPPSFTFAHDAGTIQLETVSAGDTKTRWVANMEANPLVRLRINGEVYELRAERVTDDGEMRAFADEWTKNSWARDPTTLDEVWVYRMEAR